jgi:two-component system, chemotaxis family, chemotaxis protein CheY
MGAKLACARAILVTERSARLNNGATKSCRVSSLYMRGAVLSRIRRALSFPMSREFLAMAQPAVRILIADDSEQVRSAMAFLIRGLGWEVCGAVADGEAAVEKAVELKPDLLVLDIAMPKRDGWSAGRKIRASLPDTPIVLYTFLPSSYVEDQAKQMGFQGVVEKTDPTALIAAMRSALRGRYA